jgi:hypothetical protein
MLIEALLVQLTKVALNLVGLCRDLPFSEKGLVFVGEFMR